MNCIQQLPVFEDDLVMGLSRDEIKEMIEDSVSRSVREGLDEWQKKYDLKPHHWVYLESEYNKALSRRSLVVRVILTSIVSAACLVTLWGAESWVKNVVIEMGANK